MELNPENVSEEDTSIHNTDSDEAESAFVPVDDEGFETLSAEIREVLAELAQVFQSLLSRSLFKIVF